MERQVSESLQSTIFNKLYIFFTFWSRCVVCGILVPQSGFEPAFTAVEVWYLITTGLPRKSRKVHLCKVRGKP